MQLCVCCCQSFIVHLNQFSWSRFLLTVKLTATVSGLQALQYTEGAIYCQYNCQQLLICACKAFQAVTSVTSAKPQTAGQKQASGRSLVSGQQQGLNAASGQRQGLNAEVRQSRWAPSGPGSQQPSVQGRGLFSERRQGRTPYPGPKAATGLGTVHQPGPNTAGQAEALTGLLEKALELVQAFSQPGWLTRLEGRVDDHECFAVLFQALKELANLVRLSLADIRKADGYSDSPVRSTYLA